jgi:hypothetical protein
MGDDWRVCIAFGDLPRQLKSCRRALTPALGVRLGDQVAVTSSDTRIFLYARSAGSADEAAQVAREVLARHDVSAPVRTERWSPREQEWRDAADQPSADVAAERQAVHQYRQEQERERSVRTGVPAWQVRVELPSHRDVVALAGHLAAHVSMAKLRSPVVARKKSPPLGLIKSCSGWFLLWLWLGACGRNRRR